MSPWPRFAAKQRSLARSSTSWKRLPPDWIRPEPQACKPSRSSHALDAESSKLLPFLRWRRERMGLHFLPRASRPEGKRSPLAWDRRVTCKPLSEGSGRRGATRRRGDAHLWPFGMPPDMTLAWPAADQPLEVALQAQAQKYLDAGAGKVPSELLAGVRVALGVAWQAVCKAAVDEKAWTRRATQSRRTTPRSPSPQRRPGRPPPRWRPPRPRAPPVRRAPSTRTCCKQQRLPSQVEKCASILACACQPFRRQSVPDADTS